MPATARAALETLAAQVGSAIARVQAEEALRRAKDDLEIRVAERTAQLQQANESLEAELRVRRDIEKSLRYSEAKYRTLVEQIPAITYTISLAAGVDFLYVSPQIETLLGFSPEAWRADAENWERQIHPEDRERLLAEITHSLESGEPFATEYRLLAKSGRVVWFRDEARVVYDPEGQFLFLQGLALDITERKHAEDGPQGDHPHLADPDPGVAAGHHYPGSRFQNQPVEPRGGTHVRLEGIRSAGGVSPRRSGKPAD